MRKLFSRVLGLSMMAGAVLTSCEDEFTEEQALEQQRQILEALNTADNANDLAVAEVQAQNAIALAELDDEQQMAFQMYLDSLERIGPVVNYSVSVIAAGTVNTNARTSGEAFAPGATVTVVQGGVSRTQTAGDNGVAIFPDLRIGTAIVTVSAPDHTTVTYTTNLGSPTTLLTEDNIETTVPLFPTTVAAGASQVSGTAWAKLDVTTDSAQAIQGAIVRASLSVGGALSAYGIPFGSTSKGEITSASYTDFTQVDTTDANGMYSLVIPNGLDDDGSGILNSTGTIEFLPTLATQQYVAEQGDTLALVTKPMRFDGNYSGHIDFALPSVFATVSSPEGNAPTGFALGSAVNPTDISESIIRLTNGGSGYAEDDVFTFATGVDANGNASTDYAYVYVQNVDANGRIIDLTVVDNGALYTSSPGVPTPATAAEITDIAFGQEPSGTGAAFDLSFVAYYDVFISNGGTGYSFIPDVSYSAQAIVDQGGGDVIAPVGDENIKGGASYNMGNMLDIGFFGAELELNSGVIEANESFLSNGDTIRTDVGPFASAPVFNVEEIEQRTAVVSSVNVDPNTGEVTGVSFSDFGSGYATAPTITFGTATDMGGSGATGIVEIDGGAVDDVVITNPGSGYSDGINDSNNEGTFSLESIVTNNPGFKPGETVSNFNYYYGLGIIQE